MRSLICKAPLLPLSTSLGLKPSHVASSVSSRHGIISRQLTRSNIFRQKSNDEAHQKKPLEKPDLRAAGTSDSRRSRAIISGFVLMAILFMYPSIFRPMFGLHVNDGSSEKPSKPKLDSSSSNLVFSVGDPK